jgi:hypothetical protein
MNSLPTHSFSRPNEQLDFVLHFDEDLQQQRNTFNSKQNTRNTSSSIQKLLLNDSKKSINSTLDLNQTSQSLFTPSSLSFKATTNGNTSRATLKQQLMKQQIEQNDKKLVTNKQTTNNSDDNNNTNNNILLLSSSLPLQTSAQIIPRDLLPQAYQVSITSRLYSIHLCLKGCVCECVSKSVCMRLNPFFSLTLYVNIFIT